MSVLAPMFWYEAALFFMEHEIQIAKSENRVIDLATMTGWGQLLKISHKSRIERTLIADGLERVLEKIPNDEDTLILKMSLKAIQYDLRKPLYRKKMVGAVLASLSP